MLTRTLQEIGFDCGHAAILAASLADRGVMSLDGIRFELSGRITSVFDETKEPRQILFQIER
jgi:hypothetical protein